MSYKDTKNQSFKPYFYFLNGHNDVEIASLSLATSFSDANFTEGKTESYEYNPWGVLLKGVNKNNITYKLLEYDLSLKKYFIKQYLYLSDIGEIININNSENIIKIFLNIILKKFFSYNIFLIQSIKHDCKACRATINCPDGKEITGFCSPGPACCCACEDTSSCIYVFKWCPSISISVTKCCWT